MLCIGVNGSNSKYTKTITAAAKRVGFDKQRNLPAKFEHAISQAGKDASKTKVDNAFSRSETLEDQDFWKTIAVGAEVIAEVNRAQAFSTYQSI